MPRLAGSLFRRTRGVLPMCSVIVSSAMGGMAGVVIDMLREI